MQGHLSNTDMKRKCLKLEPSVCHTERKGIMKISCFTLLSWGEAKSAFVVSLLLVMMCHLVQSNALWKEVKQVI